MCGQIVHALSLGALYVHVNYRGSGEAEAREGKVVIKRLPVRPQSGYLSKALNPHLLPRAPESSPLWQLGGQWL